MTNYAKGYNYEREVKEQLEKQGYFVIRSAGSHSAIDLIAFLINAPKGLKVLFLQLKRGKKIYETSTAEACRVKIRYEKLEGLKEFGEVLLYLREDGKDTKIIRLF